MVHIRKKILAWSDEGFRSFENFKTAYFYTQQNFDDFGKYAISVNMEAVVLQSERWEANALEPDWPTHAQVISKKTFRHESNEITLW